MKVAVIGAGGVGGYLGGRLAAAGYDVTFVARGGHLRALQRRGLAVASVAGDFTVSPVKATDDARSIGCVDYVLLCVKTWQMDSALPMLKSLVGPSTAVLTFQNGVEAPDQVAAVVGRAAVLPGIARIFAQVEGPGEIRHLGGPGSIMFNEWRGPATRRTETLRAAFARASVTATLPSDIWRELWAKMLFVVPFGSLGAATGAPLGVLRSRPGTRQLLIDGMAEVQQVGIAAGIQFDDNAVADAIAFIDEQPADATSSLQRDMAAGIRSELDAWTGAVVRHGSRTGVRTPVHSILYEILSVRRDAAEG